MIDPDARLLLATGCAHCPTVLEGLVQLLKQGKIGRLEAINISVHPEAAREAGTRSVPWTRIGPFELEGLLTPAELGRWAGFARQGEGFPEYYRHLLQTQRADKAVALLEQRPGTLGSLLDLLLTDDTPMAVRIGVGVVMEELRGNALLAAALPALLDLSASPRADIRADAAHFLGLSGSPGAIPRLQALQSDDHPDVREIAADSLEMLQAPENLGSNSNPENPKRERE